MHKAIEVLPAHPNEQNYDYLVAMQNTRDSSLDLDRVQSRSPALDYLMENICAEYRLTHQQTVDLPDLSSLVDFKNYYYFIECDSKAK